MAQKRGVPEDELPRLKDGTQLEYRFPFTMLQRTKRYSDEISIPLSLLACMRLHLFRALQPFDMAVLFINGGNVPRSIRNDAQLDVVNGRIDVWKSNKDYAMMDIIPHYDVILGMPGALSSRVFEHAQRHRTLICDNTPLSFHNDKWVHGPATTTSPETPTSVKLRCARDDVTSEAVFEIGYRKLRRTYDRVSEFLQNPDFLEYS